MKPNRASTSALPSPTFTNATTYTVPRSSPLLSSSCTPFYPRSQHQIYRSQLNPSGNHDASCHSFPQELNGNDALKSHSYEWAGPRFYGLQSYTSSGSEPYWVSDSGNVWIDNAWQWGDSVPEEYVYADDEAEDSAYVHSDSLSYYADSPALEQEFYTCSTSNTASVPTLYPDPGAAAFNIPPHSAMLERASCLSKGKEHLTSSWKNSFIQDGGASYCTSGKQGPAKSTSNNVANASSSGKLDARTFSIEASSQMCSSVGSNCIINPSITSQAVDKMKQATTDTTENTPTDSSKPFMKSCCNSNEEHEAIELKHFIQTTSNPTNTLEGINLDAPTMSMAAETVQKEVDSKNSLSPLSTSCRFLSSNGQCPGMAIPMHVNPQACSSSLNEIGPVEQRNMGSLSNRDCVVMEMGGKPRVKAINHEAMHEDKMGSSHNLPENAWLYLNRPQLLVKGIHNLSKVLLSIQSGTSLNTLDPTDCLAIENTIFILSQLLFKCSINEAQSQNCYQVAEQKSKISDDMLKLNKETGSETSQQKGSFLLDGMKQKVKISPSRILENKALDGLSKVMASSHVEGDERADQSPSMKKQSEKPCEDLLMLQRSVMKLQEEVAYERTESNAMVTVYKKLWSEAQEALKASSSEIKELRAELASFKQEFTVLKHSGPGGLWGMPANLELTKCGMNTCSNQGGLPENSADVTTGSSQCLIERDFHCMPNDDRCSAFCGSSKEPFPTCGEVMTEYSDLGKTTICGENLTPYVKSEKVILSHNNQSGNMFEISTCEPFSKQAGGAPTKLEDEVTHRLSLLLSRPGTDRNVEDEVTHRLSLLLSRPTIDRNMGVEDSSHLSSKVGAMLPGKMENYSIWFETPYMGNAMKGIDSAEADLSCQRKLAHEINRGHSSLANRESNTSNTRNVDAEDMNAQEDEVEIICLKPGVAESSFTCLKGESEWEHVVVDVLDDQKNNQARKQSY